MPVNIKFHGSIHGNYTQTANELRRIRHQLRAEEDLVGVFVPVLVESFESGGGKADGGGGGEGELFLVEEIEEGVLDHLGPHRHVAERPRSEATYDSIRDVANSRLEGEEGNKEGRKIKMRKG